MVTTEYYYNSYNGTYSGDLTELSAMLLRAEEIIDNAVYLSGYTVATVPPLLSEKACFAVCAQADSIDAAGGISALYDGSVASASLGKFSYTESSSSSPSALCEMARQHLAAAGLLYRGIRI